MIQGSDIYGRIETIETAIVNRDRSKVKDCGNCKNEKSDWDIQQELKERMKSGNLDVNYSYCKKDKCKWQKKRDK